MKIVGTDAKEFFAKNYRGLGTPAPAFTGVYVEGGDNKCCVDKCVCKCGGSWCNIEQSARKQLS